jgi:1-acyl-sn-glycerol-3-phosphate acyltransferase
MTSKDVDNAEITKWDPQFTERLTSAVGPIIKRWFRSEVRDIDRLPDHGGALIVSNHSGGMLTPDVLVFGSAFYDRFGYDRPLYTLAHNQIFVGSLGRLLVRAGVIHASRDNAAAALHSDGLVLVFPGGDYDAYRPSRSEHVIDFNGRRGYVRTALETGAPIVPTVSIGGQQTQLFLTRGTSLAKRVGLKRFRVDILPVSIGVPFGLSVFLPPNLPLPTKIVFQVLEPIDVRAQFGADADPGEVDAHVRGVMQRALDRLAKERRFPVLG